MWIPLSWGQLSRFRKGVVLCIWAIGMVSMFYTGYLYLDYGGRMPRIPQQATERVNPFEYKGRTIYVTEAEESRFSGAKLVFVLSWAAFALTAIIWGRPFAQRAA